MSTLANNPDLSPIARTLKFERRAGRAFLTIGLRDGRVHSVPLAFYPTLARARPAQRTKWRSIGRGLGFHWPDLDLDLSVRGILDGQRELAHPSAARRRKAG